MENTSRQSCAARLLDIRSYVLAARRSMLNAEPAAALFMVFVFGLIALCLLPIYLTFDLGSTWTFTAGLRDAAAPAINDVANQAESWMQITIGAALAGVILTSFTLLPSLFELAFPSVQHPLLSLVLWASIIFDYVTDWGKTWALVATWTENPFLRFTGTMAMCAFFSVGVQAILVCCVTVVLFGLFAMVRGGRRTAEAAVIAHQ
jgi:hypothetical protein